MSKSPDSPERQTYHEEQADQQENKQQSQDEASNWTVISRHKKKSHPNKRLPKEITSPAPKPPRTTGLRSVEALTAEYEKFKTQYQELQCCKEMLVWVNSSCVNYRPISKAVCLGVGSFDLEDDKWLNRRSTYVQLAAFFAIVSMIEMVTRKEVPCIFQEPAFTQSDKDFLASLGHQVVEDPLGFEAIDEDSFVYGVHLYQPHYAKALKCLPAVFVGTPYDIWDSVNRTDGLDNLQKMSETYKVFPYPQDPGSNAFSTTKLHWEPRDRAKARVEVLRKEEGEEESVDDVAEQLKATIIASHEV